MLCLVIVTTKTATTSMIMMMMMVVVMTMVVTRSKYVNNSWQTKRKEGTVRLAEVETCPFVLSYVREDAAEDAKNNTSYICHHHHTHPVLLTPSCILLFFPSHASSCSPSLPSSSPVTTEKKLSLTRSHPGAATRTTRKSQSSCWTWQDGNGTCHELTTKEVFFFSHSCSTWSCNRPNTFHHLWCWDVFEMKHLPY